MEAREGEEGKKIPLQTNKPARQEKETERGRRIPENEWELVSFYAFFGTPRGERPGLWAILADASSSSSGDLMGGRALTQSLTPPPPPPIMSRLGSGSSMVLGGGIARSGGER